MYDSKNTVLTFFKKCSVCKKEWTLRDQFIKDPSIILVGYQPNFRKLTQGFFLFNHTKCENTLSIKTGIFQDLYKGEIFSINKYDNEDCQGHCHIEGDLQACTLKCECNYVREIMQLLK